MADNVVARVKKVIRTPRFRSGVAVSGVLAVTFLLFRKKRRAQREDYSGRADDFTVEQDAMLRRIREIWSEESTAAPAL